MKSSEMNLAASDTFARAASVRTAFVSAIRRAASVTAVGLALLAGATSADAGTNGLTVNVTPLAPNLGTQAQPFYTVSYSGVKAALGQNLYSAFQVDIKNNTTSNVTNAWFKIHSTYNGSTGLPFLADSIPSAWCQPDPQYVDTTDPINPLISGLICQFDSTQLLAGVSFALVIKNPDPPSSNGDSKLKLTWTVQAGQGSADANPSSVVNFDTPEITLSVNSPAGLRSYVLANKPFKVANGGSLTQVTPPVGVPVDLNEQINGNSCSPMYKKCLTSTLSILDINGATVHFDTATPPGRLVIDLLRSKSTLKGTADINLAYKILFYIGEDGSYVIQECVPDSNLTFPWKIGSGSRCVVPPSGGIAGGTFVDSAGNFNFRVLGNTNGLVNW